MIEKITLNLHVTDVNRSLAFYIDTLGFNFDMAVTAEDRRSVDHWPTNTPLQWGMVKQGDHAVMFQTSRSLAEDVPGFDTQVSGDALTIYMQVNAIQAWYDKLQQKTEIIKPMNTTFYGMQEFTIRDCNGFILTFAQPAG